MKMTIDMPEVGECTAKGCAYNVDEGCYARAITIGDDIHPGCDTFLRANVHTKVHSQRAGVGACKVTGCAHNDDFECQTETIEVSQSGNDVRCATFATREQ